MVKELEIVSNYVLQILHMLLHHFHGLETFIGRRVEIPDGLTTSSTTHQMQSEGVFIAIVSTVVATVVATSIAVAALVAIVTIAVGAFGSPLFGLLIPIVIISSGGHPRARVAIVRVVATPIILRLWRRLLVVFALDALDACRPSNGRRDLLSVDVIARCKSSGRDTPSATDVCGPLDR
jgi:hypothetical protein